MYKVTTSPRNINAKFFTEQESRPHIVELPDGRIKCCGGHISKNPSNYRKEHCSLCEAAAICYYRSKWEATKGLLNKNP